MLNEIEIKKFKRFMTKRFNTKLVREYFGWHSGANYIGGSLLVRLETLCDDERSLYNTMRIINSWGKLCYDDASFDDIINVWVQHALNNDCNPSGEWWQAQNAKLLLIGLTQPQIEYLITETELQYNF